MNISRKGFLKLSLGTVSVLLAGMSDGIKSLFAETDTLSEPEMMYKISDKVPKAGRYQCIVCGLIVEYLPKHIEKEVTFAVCPLCKAGSEEGPKKPNEEFWKYIGANCS
jgi:anaerobic selenocysteine-containing dehydrogenase